MNHCVQNLQNLKSYKQLCLYHIHLFLPASWAPSGKDSGGAPQLKGARWFSYDELKKCSNNFSESNEIGFGGYGKVLLLCSLISKFF